MHLRKHVRVLHLLVVLHLKEHVKLLLLHEKIVHRRWLLAKRISHAIRVKSLIVRHHTLEIYRLVTLSEESWGCVATVVFQLCVVINLSSLALAIYIIAIWLRFYRSRLNELR